MRYRPTPSAGDGPAPGPRTRPRAGDGRPATVPPGVPGRGGPGRRTGHHGGGGHTAGDARPAIRTGPCSSRTPSRTNATVDPNLSVAKAPTLKLKWSFQTGGPVATSTSIVGTTAYIGSWDGYEYAVNTATGAQIWKSPSLGITTDPGCNPSTIGITSSADVENGVLYVGGGGPYWYALNASTGAILWSVYTGDNTQAGAHYNWSSPLIYNGNAYIGVASNCDNPLVQGQLLEVSLTTHADRQHLQLRPQRPAGRRGVDHAHPRHLDHPGHHLCHHRDPQRLHADPVPGHRGPQLVHPGLRGELAAALHGGGLRLGLGHHPHPDHRRRRRPSSSRRPTRTASSTPGSGPTSSWASTDPNPPLWQHQIAIGGAGPTEGDGSIASGIFANGTLFYAGGHSVINGKGSGGSIGAYDPGTGATKWVRQTEQPIIGAPAYVNGHGGLRRGQHLRGRQRRQRPAPLLLPAARRPPTGPCRWPAASSTSATSTGRCTPSASTALR